MNLTNKKKLIRKDYLLKRIKFKESFTTNNKNKLISNLKKLLKKNHFLSIAGYYPIGTEIDCLEILEIFQKKGIITALPFVKQNNCIEFREWRKHDILIEDFYGIPTPKKRLIIVPDIIIVPLLAFDKMGFRLGFGSGIYDRSLPNFSESKKIGLAFSGQLNKRGLPVSEFDYKLEAVVTEKDIFVF
tara:strand:- start:4585 stop:5145 length:561 start_codon:yes stop_codon:yes gene_type:complete